MKNLIMTLMGLLLSAHVAADVVAEYSFGKDLKGPYYELNKVELDDYGIVRIYKAKRHNYKVDKDLETPLKLIRTIEIGSKSFYGLSHDAYDLSIADIEKVKGLNNICELYVSKGATINHLKVLRNGVLELIDGPKGCWVVTPIYPKYREAQAKAALLKDSLLRIAL